MNNFCVLPFNSVSIDATGELRPCCNAHNPQFKIHLQDITVDEIINNNKIVSLRESFLNDTQDPVCSRCWEIEKIGNKSFRHVANENNMFGLQSVIPIKKQNNISYENVQYLDITLGNKCNLACRMCNPFSSSLLSKQMNELKMFNGNQLIDFSRKTKDKIIDLINKSVNLTSLYLLGGEPLVNEFHDEILDVLIKSKRSKKISIHYSTNLQIDIEKYLDLWSNFNVIDLGVSIDGSHNTYEYIRWPGKWSKVFSNLKRTCEFESEANLNITIATTVQNLNADNLYDLILECSEINNINAPFFFIPVTGENLLELTPKYVLEQQIKKLTTLPDPYGRVSDLIHFYQSACLKTDSITFDQANKFFSKQKQFDMYRKQNLFTTNPYFIDLAKQFKVETW